MIVSGTPGGKSPKHGTFAEKMDVIRKYEETAPENSRFFCFLDCHDTVLGDRERRFDRIRPVEEGNAAYVLVFLRRGIAVLYNGNAGSAFERQLLPQHSGAVPFRAGVLRPVAHYRALQLHSGGRYRQRLRR